MPEYLNNTEKNWPTKAMFAVLVFLGMATLILGTLQLGKNINIGGNRAANSVNATNGQEEAAKTVEQLQAMDTDGDGLSDFQELYVYGTSPYLKDSDSDGYSDKEEIEQGYDPNCPKGQDCRGTTNTNASVNANTNNQTLPQEESAGGESSQATSSGQAASGLTEEQKTQLKKLTPAELRELLISSGNVTEEQLQGVSDEELLRAVEESLQ